MPTKTKKRKKGGPVYHGKEGSVLVPVYARLTKGYASWEVADYTSGARRLRAFSDYAKAIQEADRIATALASGQVEAAKMTSAQAASYGRAVELLRETGLPLELAAGKFAEAFKLLGADLVVEAAKFYAEHNPANLPSKTVAEVVNELLTVRDNAGRSRRHIEDLRARLNRFAEAFNVQCATVTTALVQAWLDGLKGSEQTRKNYRTVVNNLFKFALARGYVRSNPVERTERPKPKDAAPEIYQPKEIAAMLAYASADLLPVLAIGAFAGLRSAELLRLSWGDIDLKGGHITVAADKAKTASRRLIPIQPNLGQWLASYADQKGPVWKGDVKTFYEAAHDAANGAKTRWKPNALRHSFASYRLALVKNAGQVALECGNTAEVVFKHYRELVTEAAAKAWFSIQPNQAANVVPMKEAANE